MTTQPFLSSSILKTRSTTMSRMFARLALFIGIAMFAFYSSLGTTLAAPSIPTGYHQIGPVRAWRSPTVEHYRPGPFQHKFDLPKGTKFVTLEITWVGTGNDGNHNENGVITTTLETPNDRFACADQGHGPFSCASIGTATSTNAITVSVSYNELPVAVHNRKGDSHHYEISLTPYGPSSTPDQPGGGTPNGGTTPGGKPGNGNNGGNGGSTTTPGGNNNFSIPGLGGAGLPDENNAFVNPIPVNNDSTGWAVLFALAFFSLVAMITFKYGRYVPYFFEVISLRFARNTTSAR